MKAGMFDRAWCIAAALVFLGKATSEQRAYYEDKNAAEDISKIFQRLRMPFNNDIWAKSVFHPDDDLYIGKIFEMVLASVRNVKIAQLRAARHSPNSRQILGANRHHDPIRRIFFAVSQLLALPAAPVLYVQNDQPGMLRPTFQEQPASVAGANVVTGHTPLELLFLCAKHLTIYRSEHYITSMFPTYRELKPLFLPPCKLAIRRLACHRSSPTPPSRRPMHFVRPCRLSILRT